MKKILLVALVLGSTSAFAQQAEFTFMTDKSPHQHELDLKGGGMKPAKELMATELPLTGRIHTTETLPGQEGDECTLRLSIKNNMQVATVSGYGFSGTLTEREASGEVEGMIDITVGIAPKQVHRMIRLVPTSGSLGYRLYDKDGKMDFACVDLAE